MSDSALQKESEWCGCGTVCAIVTDIRAGETEGDRSWTNGESVASLGSVLREGKGQHAIGKGPRGDALNDRGKRSGLTAPLCLKLSCHSQRVLELGYVVRIEDVVGRGLLLNHLLVQGRGGRSFLGRGGALLMLYLLWNSCVGKAISFRISGGRHPFCTSGPASP